MPRREGQYLVDDYLVNQGGLNTSDSPFLVKPNEATGGMNFDLQIPGAIRKRGGHVKLNSSANSQLKSLGFGLWNKPDTTRKPIRCAGTKWQAFDPSAHTFTNLSEDTTGAGTDFLNSNSTQPVVFSMFNQPSSGVLWGAGGGMSTIYGAYSATKVTANGVSAPTTSSFTATPAAGGSLTAGTYRYTLVYRKASTQALSNALSVTECSGTTSGGNLKLTLAWTLSNNDTTKYDAIYIYRSSISGSQGFTAGALIKIAAISDTSYTDDGTNVADSQTVPRADSTVLDNSTLPSQTFRVLTTFKRRLVTAYGSTVIFSDINKPESWPTYQTITIPSGGEITALGVLGLTSAISTDTDEALVVYKQNEVWIISGDGTYDGTIPNWSLKFLSNAGAVNQAQVVAAEGYLAWLNYKGFYMWNGTEKPVKVSRKIWDKFQASGDIDKSKLGFCFGMFSQKRNEIIWVLSSATYGEQKLCLRLDVTHTERSARSDVIGERELEGVFLPDVLDSPMYAGLAFLESSTSTEETIYFGDNAGYVYSGFTGTGEGAGDTSYTFSYLTPFLMGSAPNIAKKFHKVVLWVLDNGVYDITLTYWGDYRYAASDASSITQAVDPNINISADSLWDVGLWDEMVWDSVPSRIRALTFNLPTSNNNNEGDAIRLQFSQVGNSETPIIYGYSLYYTELALRK